MEPTAVYRDQLDINCVDEGNMLLMHHDISADIDKYDQTIKNSPYYAIPYYNKRIALSMQNDIPSNSEEYMLIARVKDLKLASRANTCFVINTIAVVPEYAFSEDSPGEESDEDFNLLYNELLENKYFPFTTSLKQATKLRKESQKKTTKLKRGSQKKTTKFKSESQILDKELPKLNKCTNSRVVDTFLSQVLKNGFDEDEQDKLSTIAVSIGLNRMESLSTRKNNSLSLEFESKVKTREIKYKKFGYYWKCAWYNTKDGLEANIDKVRKFYKQLKRKDPTLAKKLIEQEEKEFAEHDVPYQDIREYAKNHPKTKELIKELRDNHSNVMVYLHIADADIYDFNGIFSAYLRIIHGCCIPPTVMSTGYEFPKDTECMAYHLLSQMERMHRVITTFYIPLGTYYPEPNMCILIPQNCETVEESFIDRRRGRALESPILLNNIQNNRQNVYAIFSEDNPIITKIPPRAKKYKLTKKPIQFSSEFNEGPAAPTSDDIKKFNQVSQSHSNNLNWCKSLFINKTIKYESNYETDGEGVSDKNNKPLKGVDKQCVKLITNIRKENDVRSKDQLDHRIGADNASKIVDAIKAIYQYEIYFNKEYERTPEEQDFINIMEEHEVSYDYLSRRSLLKIIKNPIFDLIKDPNLTAALLKKVTVLFSDEYEDEYQASVDSITSWDFEKIEFLGSDDIINVIGRFDNNLNIFDVITEYYDDDHDLAWNIVNDVCKSEEDITDMDFASLVEEYVHIVKQMQWPDGEYYELEDENVIDYIARERNHDPENERIGFAIAKGAGLIDSGCSTPSSSSDEESMWINPYDINEPSSNEDKSGSDSK